MASLTTHCIVAGCLALPALNSRRLREAVPGWRLPFTVCALAAAPDLDLAGRRVFGIPYDSIFSHRGFFHSPFFLILFAAVVAGCVVANRSLTGCPLGRARFWLLLAACAVTHPLLDALTDGGRAVMLLFPFTTARYFFPWHPIHTPPGGLENILNRAWLIRASEIPFCLAASAIGSAGLLVGRKFGIKSHSCSSDDSDAAVPAARDRGPSPSF